jgi:hypothetical protein
LSLSKQTQIGYYICKVNSQVEQKNQIKQTGTNQIKIKIKARDRHVYDLKNCAIKKCGFQGNYMRFRSLRTKGPDKSITPLLQQQSNW